VRTWLVSRIYGCLAGIRDDDAVRDGAFLAV
jgi:hypothetical protein